ncbi:MAG: hypothetical protein DCF30_20475 [Hyphomicrobiales bacterium]|nr:MAG: hypothetical protein DCF30_20475 [Hyphomicrobiales bacterium]
MSKTEPTGGFDAALHLDAMAPALGLTITPKQRPAVLQFIAIAHVMSELVQTVPLDEASLELAAVFRPGAVGQSS